ncbi:MAG: DUF853 family protein [Gammaproteobacteria bacterium]|nr:DUF853 family protein [Gammaproteobacteria bacterium]MYL11522.1 DUF853 family protein [Cenarchaeum sp. SB0669_bin_11]
MARDPTYLGAVQDVQGATVTVRLDDATVSGLMFIDGIGYRVGQIGSFIRIPIGFVDLFGIVSQVGAGAVPEALAASEPHGYRWMRVQMIGEGQKAGAFQRGISQYPTINDEAHLTTADDLAQIYGVPQDSSFLRIGSVASSNSIPAMVDINRLVTRHSAVLGATGSGKSTTVAGILTAMSDRDSYPSARAIILDIHGEYRSAFKDRASVFRVNADPKAGERQLYIPYWALSADELLQMTPFQGITDADRASVLERIRALKVESLAMQERSGVTADTLTVDSPVPFSIHRLWYELWREVLSTHTVGPNSNQSRETEAVACDEEGSPRVGDIMSVQPPEYRALTSGGDDRVYSSGSALNIRRQLFATASLLRDPRYDFLFRPGPWCPSPAHANLNAQPESDLDDLLSSWIGADRPITILDLSGVPALIQSELIGALLRLLFDALFWGRYLPEGGRQRPLLIVLEEAHAYLSAAGNNAAATSVRRVVKEGRKYGLGAMIVSQRPSELDSGILSQCGTLFAMRLANSTDRSDVTAAASDNLQGLFDMLPSLRTGEAVVVGEAVNLPMRTLIDVPRPEGRPESDDPVVHDPAAETGWNAPMEGEDYQELLRRWRRERATEGGGREKPQMKETAGE